MDLTMMECPKCKGECELQIKAGVEYSVCLYCRSEVLIREVKSKILRSPRSSPPQRIILRVIGLVIITAFFALPIVLLSGNNNERVVEILNNRVDEIVYIHFDGRYGGYTPISPNHDDFEILLEWLLEHQNSLFDEKIDNYSINIIGLTEGRIEFYIDNTLIEEFWDFLFKRTFDFGLSYIENRIPVTDIDWHYFEGNYADYIDFFAVENSRGSFDSSFWGYELGVLSGFFAENQDLLYEEQQHDNMFEITMFFKLSGMGLENERYVDGAVNFYIDESLHDQLWTMIEVEFGIMRYWD